MQTLLNQLVYFGFFQSLLLLAIYLFSPQKRRHINPHMAFLILTLLIGLTGKVLHSAGVWGSNFRLIALSELSALLFGPAIYLFARASLERKAFSKNDLIHYLPGLVYSIFIVVYFVIPADAISVQRLQSGELMRAIYACHAIGLVVNITYWILALRVLQEFRLKIKNELSYEVHTRFIGNLLWVTGACLLIWTILYLSSFFGMDMLERNARPYIWIVLTLIILFITYYGMLSPEVLRIAPELSVGKYSNSKYSVSQLNQLKTDLDNLMLEKKPYLNNKLLKAELAEMMGISSPEMARLLNEHIGMSFFEYVNYFRIKEFVNLAKTEQAQQLTLLGLAQEAGFNSKTTFNKSFKKLMGTSPSAYFNKNS